jgi:hypothetical protein
MATGSGLIDQVGYKTIGAGLTATTMPTIAMAITWLTDGTYELMRRINPVLIPEMIKAPTALTFASGIEDLPADFFKVISVYDDVGQFKYVDPLTFGKVETNTHDYYDDTSRIFTLMDGDIYTGTNLSPTNAKMIYIKKLASAIADDATEYPMSAEIETMVVDFAVNQSKKMEEEIQQYGAYMQMWYQRIIMMNQTALVDTMI